MEQRRYRMYGLVPYNLSPIQQGIQFGHAVVEYHLKYGLTIHNVEVDFRTEAYEQWARYDKTFIVLNGGTTNHNRDLNGVAQGTLNQHRDWLWDNKIPWAEFVEPDLGNQLTAVVFLVDDRIWDREKYPEFKTVIEDRYGTYKGYKGAPIEDSFPEEYMEWVEMIGGEEQVKLRKWLEQFKFA